MSVASILTIILNAGIFSAIIKSNFFVSSWLCFRRIIIALEWISSESRTNIIGATILKSLGAISHRIGNARFKPAISFSERLIIVSFSRKSLYSQLSNWLLKKKDNTLTCLCEYTYFLSEIISKVVRHWICRISFEWPNIFYNICAIMLMYCSILWPK